MRTKLIFEAGWDTFFASHQLRAFADFFEFAKGQTINQNSKRNVIVFELDDHGQKRTFYMKRFIHPHFKDTLATLGHFGTLCSQAEVEWRSAQTLLENGIETYHPVCYGAQSRFGLEQQSFFITEQINGPCLTDYLSESWKDLTDAEKQGLIVELGQFFQQIHAAGIRLPDAYIWHIYRVKTEGTTDSYTLGMIDLHRMKLRIRGHRHAAKDLGAFLFSLPDGFMDTAFRALFIDSYLDNHRIKNTNAFQKQVKRWELKISNRRKREVSQI